MKLSSTARRTAASLTRLTVAACAVAGSLAATPAWALDVYVRVGVLNPQMPDNSRVTMWGYRVATTQAGALAGQTGPLQGLSSPGAAITVPPNDTTLRIHLLNRLPVPTSIVIHGQTTAMTPVFRVNAADPDINPANNCTPGVNLGCRVRSFTKETPPNNAVPVVYEYTNLKPGTYLYQSGTLPQIQVQMGLYGMMRKNAAATATSGFNAYDNVPYDDEIGLLFSEVDPAMHAAVAAGTFSGSTLGYDPKFFRVHRYGTAALAVPTDVTASSANNQIVTIDPGRRLLLRMLNAGLQSHSMVIDDGHWYVMAEDGNPYRFPREQYSAFLPAAKTTDVWMTPTVGNATAVDRLMTVFDRSLALSNNNNQPVGGMLFQMRVDSLNVLPQLDISTCPLTATQGVPYTNCTVSSTGAGTRAYSLDIAPVGMSIDPASGVISWTPTNEQAQRPANPTLTNMLRVRAVDSNGGIAVSPIVQIAVANVNDAPVANSDSYTVRGGSLTVTAAQSVSANDSDPDGDPLGAVTSSLVLTSVPPPATGTDVLALGTDGVFTFTAGDYSTDRTVTFTYQVADVPGGLVSNSATVTLNVKKNVAPVAGEDAAAMLFTSGGTIEIDVLANDYDIDNNLKIDSLAIAGQPNCGGRADIVGAAGTRQRILYTLPTERQNCTATGGTSTLTYTVSDTQGATSLPAAVRINIQ